VTEGVHAKYTNKCKEKTINVEKTYVVEFPKKLKIRKIYINIKLLEYELARE